MSMDKISFAPLNILSIINKVEVVENVLQNVLLFRKFRKQNYLKYGSCAHDENRFDIFVALNLESVCLVFTFMET